MTTRNAPQSASPVSVSLQAPENGMTDISLAIAKEEVKQKAWKCPASRKALRTNNPIRCIVDPIVANIKSGDERGDGKDLISLAVSYE